MIASTVGERHLNLAHARVPGRVIVSMFRYVPRDDPKDAFAKAYSLDSTVFYKFSSSSFHLLANNG